MCTAVVGGSIQRAAARISAPSDQSSTSPMSSQRINDRRSSVRDAPLVSVDAVPGVAFSGYAMLEVAFSVSGIAVTLQNNILRRLAAAGRSCAHTHRCVLVRPLGLKREAGSLAAPRLLLYCRREAEGGAGGAHRKSGVKTASISNDSARWRHTDSSVHYDYNSLLLPRFAECNWKFQPAQRAQKIATSTHAVARRDLMNG